ncbi:MAG: flagellar hook-basal body protein [Planctomycetes bacterium]|nr:flagellar hook-basal body protein [Planctomycetota bacterium]
MSSYGLWLSAAGMKVNDHRQALLANNMANANTVGFKHDLAVVMQRSVQSREAPNGLSFAHPILDGLSGGVNVQPTFHSFEQGPIERTGRPLDVAIQGEGFFEVSDGKDTRYTRNGEFSVNTKGELVLSAGEGRWKVMDDAGGPIVLEAELGKASIAGDGTVRQGDIVVARLGIKTTDDLQTLRKIGQNVFQATAKMVATKARLETESVERSTFDIVHGLASMIEATRAFELNAKMIQIQDQLTGQAVGTLGRLA